MLLKQKCMFLKVICNRSGKIGGNSYSFVKKKSRKKVEVRVLIKLISDLLQPPNTQKLLLEENNKIILETEGDHHKYSHRQ